MGFLERSVESKEVVIMVEVEIARRERESVIV